MESIHGALNRLSELIAFLISSGVGAPDGISPVGSGALSLSSASVSGPVADETKKLNWSSPVHT